MKKYLKIILVMLALGAVGGWIYWQQYKKSIIRNSIESAISKGTDSLYFIHYDSSSVDEINGNASFYNVTLQSDSLKRQLLLYDTASAATIFNVQIDEVSVRGANIPGLLNNTSIEAKTIYIKHPVVYIINSGKKEKKQFNNEDSLAIYQKLLGKFKSINANGIVIENGFLNFTDKTGETNTALRNINIALKNFKIDSTRNYENIVSYFIKDIIANVKEVYIKGDKNQATFTDVEYNAPGKFISLDKFQQKNNEGKLIFDINKTSIREISTDAFINRHQLKAGEVTSGGGMLTFYSKQKKDTVAANSEIEIDNNYFDEALVNKITVGNTQIYIYNRAKPKEAPMMIGNVKFSASDIQKLDSGTSVKNLISNSNWKLSGDGFSFLSENKRYKINIGAFEMNNANSTMNIKNFSMGPALSEEAFTRSLARQEDLYTIELNNIQLSGIDTKMLVAKQRLEATTATLQPTFKIYRDRTIAEDPTSKLGKYPHQLLPKIKFPFSIKKVNIKNGLIAYTEKGAVSKKTGVVSFKNINGTVSNLTNITDIINKNNLMLVNATGSFLGISQMQTTWKLPLSSTNGAFEVNATAGAFNATGLNAITEPLGMASIKKGQVNSANFTVTGNDLSAKATGTLLYEDLKIEILKLDSGATKKKGLQSLLANALMKDRNPQNGVTRTEEATYQRDITKSFFNLVWKSIFAAMKKTTQKISN